MSLLGALKKFDVKSHKTLGTTKKSTENRFCKHILHFSKVHFKIVLKYLHCDLDDSALF